jgi:hypothetical protein
VLSPITIGVELVCVTVIGGIKTFGAALDAATDSAPAMTGLIAGAREITASKTNEKNLENKRLRVEVLFFIVKLPL